MTKFECVDVYGKMPYIPSVKHEFIVPISSFETIQHEFHLINDGRFSVK